MVYRNLLELVGCTSTIRTVVMVFVMMVGELVLAPVEQRGGGKRAVLPPPGAAHCPFAHHADHPVRARPFLVTIEG